MTTASLSRLILKNHTTGSPRFRQEYFDQLNTHSQNFISDIESSLSRTQQIQEELELNTPTNVLNKVYKLLEPYALELNRSVAKGGFSITVNAPIFSHEEFVGQWPYEASQMVQIYRCRFVSMVLSANIRVRGNEIGFYLIPAEQAIRQSEAEEEHGPLMLFSNHGDTRYSRFGDNAKACWWVEGKPLTDDRFERYSLLFFDHFIKNSQKLMVERLKQQHANL